MDTRSIAEIQSDFDRITELIEAMIGNMLDLEPKLALAYIPTLFDYVCEKLELDKMKTWEMLGEVVKKVNKIEGPMLPHID